MDALTAGTVLILVQFCIALVMAGVFFAAPTDKCTRHWALSGSLIALGVLIAILNNRIPRVLALLSGSGLIAIGLIYQWYGILVFYNKQPPRWGWLIPAIFLFALSVMLYADGSAAQRSILFSATTVILFVLSFHAIWQGQGGWPHTFVQRLVQSALLLSILCQLVKIGIMALYIHRGIPVTTLSTPEVVVTYLVPTVGTVLFSIGLLLLYFERTVEENRHLATHDELSKLLNRRAIVAAGMRELELAVRLQRKLTVAFIDIDLFKRFNDEFGHAAGDAVITDVATILQQTCRTIDLVGRYGGEEFLIILPGVDSADAAMVGARLLEAMRAYYFRGVHPVTISIGLANLPAATPCSWEQLIRRADAALYQAKELGRDRCI